MATTDLIRSFVALELSAECRDALRRLVRRSRQRAIKASWVRPQNLHVTLCFLGDVSRAGLASFTEALQGAIGEIRPFPLHIHGVGVFPSLKEPRVLWAGAEAQMDVLLHLKRIVDEAAKTIGVSPEKRAFSGHITLARIRNLQEKAKILELVERERLFDGGEFVARTVSLFESRLTVRGSVYKKLEEFPF